MPKPGIPARLGRDRRPVSRRGMPAERLHRMVVRLERSGAIATPATAPVSLLQGPPCKPRNRARPQVMLRAAAAVRIER